MATEERTILLKLVVDDKGAVKGLKGYEKAVDSATDATEEATVATKDQNKATEKNTKDNKKAAKSTKEYAGAMSGLDKAISALPPSLQGAAKGAVGLTKSLKGVKIAIAATGIGVLLIALGSLFSWFNRTQEGGEKLNKIMGFMGAAFDVVLDVVGDFGEALFNAISQPQELFNSFKQGVSDFFSDPLGFAKEAAIAVGEKIGEIAGEIKSDAEAGFALSDRENKLQQRKLDFVVREQNLRDEIAEQRLRQENQEISAAERLKANLEAQRLIRQVASESIEIAQETADIERERQALGDSNYEDKLALAELDRNIIALNTAQNTELKTIVTRQKAITAEVVKENEEREKIAENARIRAEDRNIEIQSQAEFEVQIESDKQAEIKGLREEGTKTGIELEKKRVTASEKWAQLEADQKAALIGTTAKSSLKAIDLVFGASKESAIAQTLIDTALAIIASAKIGFPAALPGVILAGVTGAASLANILSTPKPKIPQFARGGMMHGNLHTQGGIDVELESGEAVINRRSMSNPYLRELASQINQVGGGIKFAEGGLVGISEAQNILNNTLSNISNVQAVPVLVTEDLDAVQSRIAVTEEFSTL